MLVLARSLTAGCAPDGPLGMVGTIVTAPFAARVMFVSARMNDREYHVERARQNHRPPPPIDADSGEMARATLEQVPVQAIASERSRNDYLSLPGFGWMGGAPR